MTRGVPRERGIALLISVAALAGLGVLSLTALALARTEREAGLAAVARVQARGAAEAALAQALLGWPAGQTPTVSGQEYQLGSFSGAGGASGTARVRSLGGPIYALQAVGFRGSAAGRELGSVRIEMLVILGPADSNGVTHPRRYPRGWRLLP